MAEARLHVLDSSRRTARCRQRRYHGAVPPGPQQGWIPYIGCRVFEMLCCNCNCDCSCSYRYGLRVATSCCVVLRNEGVCCGGQVFGPSRPLEKLNIMYTCIDVRSSVFICMGVQYLDKSSVKGVQSLPPTSLLGESQIEPSRTGTKKTKRHLNRNDTNKYPK